MTISDTLCAITSWSSRAIRVRSSYAAVCAVSSRVASRRSACPRSICARAARPRIHRPSAYGTQHHDDRGDDGLREPVSRLAQVVGAAHHDQQRQYPLRAPRRRERAHPVDHQDQRGHHADRLMRPPAAADNRPDHQHRDQHEHPAQRPAPPERHRQRDHHADDRRRQPVGDSPRQPDLKLDLGQQRQRDQVIDSHPVDLS